MLSEQLKQRLSIGTIITLILILVIYYSQIDSFQPVFIMLTSATIGFSLLEYYNLAIFKGWTPLSSLGIVSGISYVIAVAISIHNPLLRELPAIVLWGTLLLSCLLFFNRRALPLVNLAITMFGLVYIVLPLSFVVRINYFLNDSLVTDGRLWLSYVLITSKATDMGAYFSGKVLGKHPLSPYISPNKTIEGALGGTLLAIVYSLLFSLFFSGSAHFHLAILDSLWLGAVLSILAQFGDLTESLFKRDAGVKNSSHLPGLGGILDMVDSLIFTLPLTYFLLRMHIIG